MECKFFSSARLIPNRTYSAIPIACTASHSAQNIAFDELARQAIMADPEWSNGNYLKLNKNSSEWIVHCAYGRTY